MNKNRKAEQVTYTTNTRPDVHTGDTITIGNPHGYHETIKVGSATTVDTKDGTILHVHQAETGDIYEIGAHQTDGWHLEHVECPHPAAMRFPDCLPHKNQCMRCAWADWLTFPDVEPAPQPAPPAYRPHADKRG